MEKTKDELIKDVNQKLSEINQMEETSKLLTDNSNEFLILDKLYRVHKPTASEKDEINKERMKKYISFLNDPMYLFRKQLVDMLKKKGVDIVKMEEETQKLFNKEKELLKKLAIATITADIDPLKKEIEEVRYEARKLFFQIEEYLQYCIEKQLEDVVRFYTLYLVLEVRENQVNFERKYRTYEDFQNADDDLLLGRAAQVLAALVYENGI